MDAFEEARLIRLAKAYLLKNTLTGGVAKTGHPRPGKPLTPKLPLGKLPPPRRQ